MSNFRSDIDKEPIKIETKDLYNQETVLLVDSDGLSHYTAYLAFGLSNYRDIILYGFSKDYYDISGAVNKKRVKFYNVQEKLLKGNSVLKIILDPLFLFFMLFNAFTKLEFDIVHIQGYLPMFFFFIPIIKLRRKKIFWTVHDTFIMPSYRGVRGKLELIYTNVIAQPRLVTKYSDTIIVHSQSLKEQLESRGVDGHKIHVIPHFDYRYLLNYFDSYQMNKQTKIDIIKSRDTNFRNYVLFFGHITPYKGIDTLIKASQVVRKRTKHNNLFNVIIAGNGDISYFDCYIKEDDRKYIHIYNKYITGLEIPDLLSHCSFLVLPYTKSFTSQSGVIPLAYTFSKPVIVSNVDSLAEYVEHDKTGFIFDYNNSQQLAEYMIELLENRAKCSEMGKNAHKKVLREMSLERCCEILNELYKMNR